MAASNGAKSFATLLRNSKFITQGDFRNSTVLGQVFHTTNDDLYVDVGMKFHAVVKKPREDARLYVRGSTVRLRLIDYEIADRFIGSSKMTSLLEADAVLLGLESTPVGSRKRK
uniref:28S ribosomal protein S28, mitochondrial n=1 Tax=Aceria tosichella TaxID=561515 RepID=A0A6G1SQ05_9ACAR